MKRSHLALLILLVAAFIGLGIHHFSARAAAAVVEPARPVALGAAAPGWVDVQGGTRRLSAKTDGIVIDIAAVTGELVAAGAVLLRLDDQTLRLDEKLIALELTRQQQSVQALTQQLALAQQELSRVQALVAMQAEASDVLRQAEAQVQALRSSRHAAQLAMDGSRLQQQKLALQLTQQVLRAPSRGRVLRADAQVGESVSSGAPVLWFAPEAPLIVRAEVDERLIAQLKVGMAATVEAEAGDGQRYPAKLLRIAHAVGPVRALPEVRAAAKDDHVVECVLSLGEAPLLIGQRVIVRMGDAP